MNTYYAVAQGRVPGIYKTWEDTKKHIDGFKDARFKKFTNLADAQSFVEGHRAVRQSKISDFFEQNGPIKKEAPAVQPVQAEETGTLVVFTDGACAKNGTPRARASCATVWPFHSDLDGGFVLSKNEPHSNNRGEYHAVIRAFEQADFLDPGKQRTLIVYTDSQLLINSLTKWIGGWKRNNWKKSNGEVIANLDLVTILDSCIQNRKTIFKHVRAHTGGKDWYSVYNDKVDKIATGLTFLYNKNK